MNKQPKQIKVTPDKYIFTYNGISGMGYFKRKKKKVLTPKPYFISRFKRRIKRTIEKILSY